MGAAVISGFGLMNVNAAEGEGTEVSASNEVVSEGSSSSTASEVVSEGSSSTTTVKSDVKKEKKATVSKSSTEVKKGMVVKPIKITRKPEEKRELGILNTLVRMNVNGNPVGNETQNIEEILAHVQKHVGKVIHIENRIVLNHGKGFDKDIAQVSLHKEGERAGWFTESFVVLHNGVEHYKGVCPEFIVTAVRECLELAVEKQEKVQIIVKPANLVK